MKLGRVLVRDMAGPVLTLVADGAHYDVALLERGLGAFVPASGADFYTRVVSARLAGLAELWARIAGGKLPPQARLDAPGLLPLPPCDEARSALWQAGPHALAAEEPAFRQRDARALVGDGQPVSFPAQASAPALEVGAAVMIADDLARVSAREAERAVLGATLCLGWTCDLGRWERPALGADAPIQLGPFLVTGPAWRRLVDEPLAVTVGEVTYRTTPAAAGPFRIGELLAYLSQHVALRAGDVIALGCAAGASFPAADRPLAFRERVSVTVAGVATLRGWPVPGPALGAWRAAPSAQKEP